MSFLYDFSVYTVKVFSHVWLINELFLTPDTTLYVVQLNQSAKLSPALILSPEN